MSKRILVLSGCGWNCSGGGQRPVALAREFVRQGIETAYYSTVDRRTLTDEGVAVFADGDWPKVLGWAETGPRGWVLATLSRYVEHVEALAAQGWRVLYDLLDDWEAFRQYNDVGPDIPMQEPRLLALADAVTCSAPLLVERAVSLGRNDARLILNGGPAELLEFGVAPEDFLAGSPSAVYSGYLFGSWMDWRCLKALGEAGIATTVVGDFLTDPNIPNVRFVGSRPYWQAMRYVAAADAGIVPFRHREICRAVDPIKAYDYWAAGLWTVATPEMEALRGRPFVLFATPTEFPEAVREAAQRRLVDKPDAEFIRCNSWAERARDFVRLLWPAATTVQRRPLPEPSMPEAKCRLRVTWQAPASCNMVPPCSYCNNARERLTKPQTLEGSVRTWVSGFARLADYYGPLYLSACYGEPLSDPKTVEIIAQVANWSRIDLSTNLLAPLRALASLPRNGNIALATSFHPHAWASVEDFIQKRRQVEAGGIRCGIASICCWPPLLKQVPQWIEELRAAGIEPSLLPFWGHWQGKSYPTAYTEKERMLVYGEGDPAGSSGREHWRGRLCRAGKDYLWVSLVGDASRCYMPSRKLGNLLTDAIAPEKAATACESEVCPCPNMWRFQEASDASATD